MYQICFVILIINFFKDLIRDDFEIVVFNPRYDGDFFDTDWITAFEQSPKKPSLIGYNTHEGAFLCNYTFMLLKLNVNFSFSFKLWRFNIRLSRSNDS